MKTIIWPAVVTPRDDIQLNFEEFPPRPEILIFKAGDASAEEILRLPRSALVNLHYKNLFEQAKRVDKGNILKEYLEQHPDLAAKSEWYKTAISRSALVRPPKSPTYRPDPRKKGIAELYRQHPHASQVEICKMIDRLPRPLELPPSWQKEMPGDRTWYGAYMNPNLRKRVKTYLSKIRSATL